MTTTSSNGVNGRVWTGELATITLMGERGAVTTAAIPAVPASYVAKHAVYISWRIPTHRSRYQTSREE